MNYMKQVAQMLGVELEEKFMLNGYSNKFKFTDYAMYYNCEGVHWVFAPTEAINGLLNGKYKINKLSKPILDEKEKEYLSYLIRPFRNKVQYITKIRYCTAEEIFIGYKGSPDDVSISNIVLPYFDIGTMYKGMKEGKDYTLEELGL